MASFRTVHAADARFKKPEGECLICLADLKDVEFVVVHDVVEKGVVLRATCAAFYDLKCFYAHVTDPHGKECGICRKIIIKLDGVKIDEHPSIRALQAKPPLPHDKDFLGTLPLEEKDPATRAVAAFLEGARALAEPSALQDAQALPSRPEKLERAPAPGAAAAAVFAEKPMPKGSAPAIPLAMPDLVDDDTTKVQVIKDAFENVKGISREDWKRLYSNSDDAKIIRSAARDYFDLFNSLFNQFPDSVQKHSLFQDIVEFAAAKNNLDLLKSLWDKQLPFFRHPTPRGKVLGQAAINGDIEVVRWALGLVNDRELMKKGEPTIQSPFPDDLNIAYNLAKENKHKVIEKLLLETIEERESSCVIQ